MAFAVEEDEPANPRNIGLLGPPAIVTGANGRPDAVEKAGLVWSRRRRFPHKET
jgi:hypothetical protein